MWRSRRSGGRLSVPEESADIVKGRGDEDGERGDFGRGRDDVGDHDDVEAGGAGGADAGVGILERIAGRSFYAEAADGFEVDVGLGFAAGDFVAADEDGEVAGEADLLEAEARDGSARGGGDGERDAARGKVVEDFADAGFDGKAVLLDVIIEESVAFMRCGFVVEAWAEGFAEEVDAGLMRAADERCEEGVGHGVAVEEGGFLPGDAGDALGVEDEAVHVEDDAGLGREVHERGA